MTRVEKRRREGEDGTILQLFSTTEKLEFEPARYWIRRVKRLKYNCGKCHGAMVNTSALPSIVAKSPYGDNFIIHTSLTKYCDLIPIERQVNIAERNKSKYFHGRATEDKKKDASVF